MILDAGLLPAATAPDAIDRMVDEHPVEPGRQLGVRNVRWLAVKAEKRLLHGVLCLLGPPQHPEGGAVERATRQPVDLRERRRLPTPTAFRQARPCFALARCQPSPLSPGHQAVSRSRSVDVRPARKVGNGRGAVVEWRRKSATIAEGWTRGRGRRGRAGGRRSRSRGTGSRRWHPRGRTRRRPAAAPPGRTTTCGRRRSRAALAPGDR